MHTHMCVCVYLCLFVALVLCLAVYSFGTRFLGYVILSFSLSLFLSVDSVAKAFALDMLSRK